MSAAACKHPVDIRDGARDGDAAPAVDRRDLDAGRAGGLEEASGLAVAQHQRGHAAAAAHAFLVAAAGDHDIDGLVEAERAGTPGRGDLADAVAQGGAGHDATLLERANGGDLQREQQGLRIGRPPQARRQIVGEQRIDDRPFLDLREMTVDVLQGVAEDRIGLPGVAAHAGPLRAVAGEQEGERLVDAQRLAGEDRGGLLALDEGGEMMADLVRRLAPCDEAVRQRIAQIGAGGDEGGGLARSWRATLST